MRIIYHPENFFLKRLGKDIFRSFFRCSHLVHFYGSNKGISIHSRSRCTFLDIWRDIKKKEYIGSTWPRPPCRPLFLSRGMPIPSDLSDYPLANSCGIGTYAFEIS
jgi:hypothetical protein